MEEFIYINEIPIKSKLDTTSEVNILPFKIFDQLKINNYSD